jgi:uncharacterized protein with von Willebrand factor type A (vWA) domain
MFLDLLYELRARRVPVGAQEAVALARALVMGLHDSSLDGFYHVARSLLVHSERHLDDFDLAFGKVFHGLEVDAKAVADQLAEWLKDPKLLRELSDEERAAIEELSSEEVMRLLQQRLREQTERHDGGNRWVGTGGTSPFGNSGFNPNGVKIGGAAGGRGGAMKSADARAYKPYRSDVALDIRQMEVAWRKLRAFAREGADRELDIDETIDRTAKNAGELEVVVRPPRRPNTRVILMMDVGGSMDPYAHLLSQLFSAAKRATHWKELRTYYFHNCIYGRVYKTEGFSDPVRIRDLMADCDKRYKLVLVGDASMASYELLGSAGLGDDNRIPGLGWLMLLREHFERSVWINPDPPNAWSHPTVEAIGSVFPMFALSLDGLDDAVKELIGARRGTQAQRRA